MLNLFKKRNYLLHNPICGEVINLETVAVKFFQLNY